MTVFDCLCLCVPFPPVPSLSFPLSSISLSFCFLPLLLLPPSSSSLPPSPSIFASFSPSLLLGVFPLYERVQDKLKELTMQWEDLPSDNSDDAADGAEAEEVPHADADDLAQSAVPQGA